MDKNCLWCEHGSHYNGSGFKCANQKSEYKTDMVGNNTFFLEPKENCNGFLIKFGIMRDYLQKNFDKIFDMIENK